MKAIRSISNLFILGILLSIGISACEEPYIPETFEADQQLVLEGYVEAGEGARPTFVLLTRSIPFVGTISPQLFGSLFVRGADIRISDGDKEVRLTELCLENLPEDIRKQALELLGLGSADSVNLNVCAYVDIADELTREIGRSYTLRGSVGDVEISATTTIPELVPINNFRWDDPPGEPNDTFAQLFVRVDDPVGVQNFYRYLTATEGGPLIPPPFGSVTDDAIFDGQDFEFPLSKAERRGDDTDFNTFGLYRRDDTVTIKWCNIDKEHFDFWNTRDRAASSGGPFSGYVRIRSNVRGALGVFGGYAVSVYELYCPPK